MKTHYTFLSIFFIAILTTIGSTSVNAQLSMTKECTSQNLPHTVCGYNVDNIRHGRSISMKAFIPQVDNVPFVRGGAIWTQISGPTVAIRGRSSHNTREGDTISAVYTAPSVSIETTLRFQFNVRLGGFFEGTSGTLYSLEVQHVVLPNNSPQITFQNGVDRYSLDLAENTKFVATVTAMDEDDGDILTYSLPSNRQYNDLFEITNDGDLSFKDAYIPDFENPRNNKGVIDPTANQFYIAQVEVSDGSLSDSQLIIVRVTDVDETLNTGDFSTKSINIRSTSNRTLQITGLNNKKASVQLFDISGKEVLKTTLLSSHSEVKLSKGIKAGIYIVRINTLNGGLSKKIILK